MDLSFFIILARSLVPALVALGKPDQAALLGDAVTAVQSGKNIDDIMAAFAKKWQEQGEPSFDEIEEARKAIQERIGG